MPKPRITKDKVWIDKKSGQLLNNKHELFTQMWVQTFNHEKSLAAAGYKKSDKKVVTYNQCASILKRTEVKERMRVILADRVAEFAVDESFIILKMMDIYDKAISEKAIVNGEGEVVGSEYQDLRVAMQTIEKMGINIGMFQKKVDDRAGAVVINMNYGNDQKQLPNVAIDGVAKRLN